MNAASRPTANNALRIMGVDSQPSESGLLMVTTSTATARAERMLPRTSNVRVSSMRRS